MPDKTANISLDPEIKDKIKDYYPGRGKNRSAVINYALEKMFAEESPDRRSDQQLERVIKRWVFIPFTMPVKSFWNVLHLLGRKYPNHSAKAFWGEPVFCGPRELTHSELVEEIKRDYEFVVQSQIG